MDTRKTTPTDKNGKASYNVSILYNLRDNYVWYLDGRGSFEEGLKILHISGLAKEYTVRGTEIIVQKWQK